MTTYYIKRSKGNYELLKPIDTHNPKEDVGHWKPVFGDENFSNFYYSLLDEIFPNISEEDTLIYDTTIATMERDHINPVFDFYKAINSARDTLVQAFDDSEEIVFRLLEEAEEGMGMPLDIIVGLHEKIEFAIKELSFD